VAPALLKRAWLRSPLARVAVLLTALTMFLTWPQALHLGSQTANHDDPLFSIWRLSWVAHALSDQTARLFDANIFHPQLRTLANSDAMLLQAFLAAPWLWAQANPVLIYNLLLLGGIVLSGLGMFVLAHYLLNEVDAALVSATIFTLVPYRVEHFMHLELQWTVWMPLTFWAAHRAYNESSVRFGALVGVFLSLQMLSSIYYGAFLGVMTATLVVLLAATQPRLAAAAVRPFFVGATIFAGLIAPYAIPYIENARALGPRDPGQVANFSARLGSYISAPHENWLWGWTAFEYPGNELHLFAGVVALGLAIIGIGKGPKYITRIYLAIVAVAVVLSFGSRGPVYGWLYEHVRALQGFRAPSRFAILACCALAVLAGFGYRALREIVTRRGVRRWLLTAVLVAIGVEYGSAPMNLVDVPTAVPDLYKVLAKSPRSPLIEFPLVDWDLTAHYMYWSIHHWHPLVNGYSGYAPPGYEETRALMRTFPDDESIARLRALNVRHIVVHQTFYKASQYAALMDDVIRRPELSPAGRYRDWIGWAEMFELKPAP
jgi:hypothetical protein